MNRLINIKYTHLDPYHIFTSDELHGLFVVSTDLKLAIKDLAPSIETIVRLNFGQEVIASPITSITPTLQPNIVYLLEEYNEHLSIQKPQSSA